MRAVCRAGPLVRAAACDDLPCGQCVAGGRAHRQALCLLLHRCAPARSRSPGRGRRSAHAVLPVTLGSASAGKAVCGGCGHRS